MIRTVPADKAFVSVRVDIKAKRLKNKLLHSFLTIANH